MACTAEGRDGCTGASAVRHERRWLVAILVAGFLLRAGAVLWLGATAHPIDNYADIARSLLGGDGYRAAPGLEPNMRRPPVYPAFLWAVHTAFGPSVLPVLLVQAAVGTLTVWGVFALGARTLDRRSALVGAALFAAYPFAIWYATLLLSETLFTFLLVLAVYLWSRLRGGAAGWMEALGAGFVFGLATLCRPIVLLLPAGVAVDLIARRSAQGLCRRVILAAVLLVGLAAAVFPWTCRNLRVSGAWVPVAVGLGHAFYEGNVLGPKPPPGGGFGLGRYDPEREKRRLDLFRRMSELGGRAAVEADRRFLEEGLAFARERPGLFARRVARKALLYAYALSWPTRSKLVLAIAIQAPIFLVALLGLWRLRGRWAAATPLLGTLAYFWVAHSLVIVWLRLCFPIMPLVLLLAAAAAPAAGGCRRRPHA